MSKFDEGYQYGQERANELIADVKARASFHDGWCKGFRDMFEEAYAEYPGPENNNMRGMLYEVWASEMSEDI